MAGDESRHSIEMDANVNHYFKAFGAVAMGKRNEKCL